LGWRPRAVHMTLRAAWEERARRGFHCEKEGNIFTKDAGGSLAFFPANGGEIIPVLSRYLKTTDGFRKTLGRKKGLESDLRVSMGHHGLGKERDV